MSPDGSKGGEIWRTKGRNAGSKAGYAGEEDEPRDKIRAEKEEK